MNKIIFWLGFCLTKDKYKELMSEGVVKPTPDDHASPTIKNPIVDTDDTQFVVVPSKTWNVLQEFIDRYGLRDTARDEVGNHNVVFPIPHEHVKEVIVK